MFVEPEIPGYHAEEPGRAEPRVAARAPDHDARDDAAARLAQRHRLGQPAPLRDDDPVVPNLGRRRLPTARRDSDDRPLPTLDELVGRAVPPRRTDRPGRRQAAMFSPAPTAGMTIEQ